MNFTNRPGTDCPEIWGGYKRGKFHEPKAFVERCCDCRRGRIRCPKLGTEPKWRKQHGAGRSKPGRTRLDALQWRRVSGSSHGGATAGIDLGDAAGTH